MSEFHLVNRLAVHLDYREVGKLFSQWVAGRTLGPATTDDADLKRLAARRYDAYVAMLALQRAPAAAVPPGRRRRASARGPRRRVHAGHATGRRASRQSPRRAARCGTARRVAMGGRRRARARPRDRRPRRRSAARRPPTRLLASSRGSTTTITATDARHRRRERSASSRRRPTTAARPAGPRRPLAPVPGSRVSGRDRRRRAAAHAPAQAAVGAGVRRLPSRRRDRRFRVRAADGVLLGLAAPGRDPAAQQPRRLGSRCTPPLRGAPRTAPSWRSCTRRSASRTPGGAQRAVAACRQRAADLAAGARLARMVGHLPVVRRRTEAAGERSLRMTSSATNADRASAGGRCSTAAAAGERRSSSRTVSAHRNARS